MMILKSDPDCAVSKPEERLRSVVYDFGIMHAEYSFFTIGNEIYVKKTQD